MFFGWWVVLASFIQLTTTSGLVFYGLGVYLNALHDERGFSVRAMSGATALFFLMSGAVGLVVARLLRRLDPRAFLPVGSLVVGVSLILLGRAVALWQVYAAYLLLAVGFTSTTIVITNTVVTRWFHRRRSLALSLATSGLSVGGIVLTPFIQAMVDDVGMRSATPRIALFYFLGVVPIPLLLLRPDPARMGLWPDGDTMPTGTARSMPGLAVSDAVTTRLFRGITLAFLLGLCAQVGGLSHVVQMAKERDTASTARLAVSTLAFFSMTGRLVGGAALSRISARTYALGVLLLEAVGLATLAFVSGRPAIIGAAALFGTSVGNVLLLHPLLLAEEFGVRDYPQIYARSQFPVNLGIAAGPFVLGLVHDGLGGYRTAYLVASGLALSGALVFRAVVLRTPSLDITALAAA